MRVRIVGGGIGDLAPGLMPRKAGGGCAGREAVPSSRAAGVGINALPHSIRELAALDPLPARDRTGISTHRLTDARLAGFAERSAQSLGATI